MELSDILGIRSTVEQPVNSRFFRHPAVAVPGYEVMSMLFLLDFQFSLASEVHAMALLCLLNEAVVQRLRLHRQVVQLGTFGAPSACLVFHVSEPLGQEA